MHSALVEFTWPCSSHPSSSVSPCQPLFFLTTPPPLFSSSSTSTLSPHSSLPVRPVPKDHTHSLKMASSDWHPPSSDHNPPVFFYFFFLNSFFYFTFISFHFMLIHPTQSSGTGIAGTRLVKWVRILHHFFQALGQLQPGPTNHAMQFSCPGLPDVPIVFCFGRE